MKRITRFNHPPTNPNVKSITKPNKVNVWFKQTHSYSHENSDTLHIECVGPTNECECVFICVMSLWL